jgi:hypothetical protein
MSVRFFLNIHNPWCGAAHGDVNTCARGTNGNKESEFSGTSLFWKLCKNPVSVTGSHIIWRFTWWLLRVKFPIYVYFNTLDSRRKFFAFRTVKCKIFVSFTLPPTNLLGSKPCWTGGWVGPKRLLIWWLETNLRRVANFLTSRDVSSYCTSRDVSSHCTSRDVSSYCTRHNKELLCLVCPYEAIWMCAAGQIL